MSNLVILGNLLLVSGNGNGAVHIHKTKPTGDKLLKIIWRSGPQQPKDIALKMKMNGNAIRQLCFQLRGKDLLDRQADGSYGLTELGRAYARARSNQRREKGTR